MKSHAELVGDCCQLSNVGLRIAWIGLAALAAAAAALGGESAHPLLQHQAAMGDWTTDAPGVRRLITVADMPPPYATKSSDNSAHLVPRPADEWPKAPPGFTVDLLAERLSNPRKITTAPNGDLFVAESGPGMPDVLVASHSASMCLLFYTANQFPARYRGWAFAPQHGSWNRARRTGYKVIAVPIQEGKANGEYEDFLTGFVTPSGGVWGRPVGITIDHQGSLLVVDDGSNSIWRVRYTGNSAGIGTDANTGAGQ